MKMFVLSSAAALLLATGAAQADSTHTDNMYASILGGASFDPALMAGGSLHDMDTGYNIGARFGYGLDNLIGMPGFSVEADTFWNSSGYKANASHLASTSFMGNLVYHLNTGGPLMLYGGAGLGAVNDRVGGDIHASSTVLGWQALGGIEYPVSNDMSLFTEYRYQNAHDANVGALSGVGNTSNNLSVGMKFSL
ncbi:MAG TPA: outer membrane beta-barrel protein [Rhizomicrobium sp.]